MAFSLSPPLSVDGKTAASLLCCNDRYQPEPLLITLSGWTPFHLFYHWMEETEALLSQRRAKACIVSGLTSIGSVNAPSEWWTMYIHEGGLRLGYQVLRFDQVQDWRDPSRWWENVGSYDTFFSDEPRPSEWYASLKDLADWRSGLSLLLTMGEGLGRMEN